jgi:DNA-binding HxlR family transcriptional regulator
MAKFPREGEIVSQLQQLFEKQQEYTFSALVRLLKPPSAELLALILDELAKQGAIVRVFRLESPFSHGSLQEFKSILDVPDHFYDQDNEREFEVRPENVLSIFRRTDLEHSR